MFKIYEINGHIQSIYIIEYTDKILLADCATRADLYRIEDFVTRQMGRKMGDVKLAVVSHMHPDHAGLAGVLQKKYNIPILAHPYANKWYAGFLGRLQHLIDVLLAWYVSIKMKNPAKRMWYPASLKFDYVANNGDRLPFFDDWQIIYTPGHTSHDISLYHRQTKTIYLGDTILKIKDKFLLPMPVTLPKLMAESLNILANLEIHEILLAHGKRAVINECNKFFNRLKELLDVKKKGIFAFINFISFFPPCIRNIDDC
jgi:glyoxylase-like metal-dependent hydrolase (beta-lactamase superfamily II)